MWEGRSGTKEGSCGLFLWEKPLPCSLLERTQEVNYWTRLWEELESTMFWGFVLVEKKKFQAEQAGNADGNKGCLLRQMNDFKDNRKRQKITSDFTLVLGRDRLVWNKYPLANSSHSPYSHGFNAGIHTLQVGRGQPTSLKILTLTLSEGMCLMLDFPEALHIQLCRTFKFNFKKKITKHVKSHK